MIDHVRRSRVIRARVAEVFRGAEDLKVAGHEALGPELLSGVLDVFIRSIGSSVTRSENVDVSR